MVQNSFVGGTLNLLGVRPGDAFAYEGATMPRRICYAITLRTTYEAIEKLVLPPPLKADRSRPPELTITFFTNVGNLAFDGRHTPYQACIFIANTIVDGVPGSAGWEYVDGIRNDKTEMDMMGLWGAYIGMLKKMADIHFVPIGVNRFEISVRRRGVDVVKMRLSLGNELSADVVEAMNTQMADLKIFTVREIPSVEHRSFIDNSICMTPMGKTNRVTRAFEANMAEVEFGHLEMDPFDEVPVIEIVGASAFEMSVGKEFFTAIAPVRAIADGEEAGAVEASVMA